MTGFAVLTLVWIATGDFITAILAMVIAMPLTLLMDATTE